MAEGESGHEVKKTVVYEASTKESPKTILPVLIIVGMIVVALLVFIFTRMN